MSKVGIKELATILAKKRKLDSEAALAFVESFFDVLCDSLRDEKMVKVKGLGTFKVVPVSARKSVDVNTGESIEISGRDKISFTPDTTLRDLVNRPFAQFETVMVNEGVDFTAIDEAANLSQSEADVDEPETAAHGVEPLPVETQSQVNPEVEEPKTVAEPQTPQIDEAIEGAAQAVEEAEEVGEESSESQEATPACQPEKEDAKVENIETVPEPVEVPAVEAVEPTPMPVTVVDDSAQMLSEVLRKQNEQLSEANDLLREQLEHSHHLMRLIGIAVVVVLLLVIGGGYYMFTNFSSFARLANTATTPQVAVVANPLSTAKDTVPVKVVEQQPAVEVQHKDTTKHVAAKEKDKPAAEPQPMTEYNNDARVRTGAYNIIGVKTTVKVRAGQTLASISKYYLGPGMECYVEAINGTREVKEGQMIKIPELKIKRR